MTPFPPVRPSSSSSSPSFKLSTPHSLSPPAIPPLATQNTNKRTRTELYTLQRPREDPFLARDPPALLLQDEHRYASPPTLIPQAIIARPQFHHPVICTADRRRLAERFPIPWAQYPALCPQLTAHSTLTAPVHSGSLFDLRPLLPYEVPIHSIINPLLRALPTRCITASAVHRPGLPTTLRSTTAKLQHTATVETSGTPKRSSAHPTTSPRRKPQSCLVPTAHIQNSSA